MRRIYSISAKKYCVASAIVCGILVVVPSTRAATITWTNWASATSGNPGSAQGTLALSPSITVAYTGQNNGLGSNYPSWTPTATFSGGPVSNAPPSSFNSVRLNGGSTATNTITFSAPVSDPVMAIWSLGAPGRPASFDFTASEPFSLQSGGRSAEYGGSSITVSGNDVLGSEGNGVIQFSGDFSQLTWTNPSFEFYYAFTLGVAGPAGPPTPTVPEPAGVALSGVGFGLLLLGALRRRAARS